MMPGRGSRNRRRRLEAGGAVAAVTGGSGHRRGDMYAGAGSLSGGGASWRLEDSSAALLVTAQNCAQPGRNGVRTGLNAARNTSNRGRFCGFCGHCGQKVLSQFHTPLPTGRNEK